MPNTKQELLLLKKRADREKWSGIVFLDLDNSMVTPEPDHRFDLSPIQKFKNKQYGLVLVGKNLWLYRELTRARSD